MRVEEVLMRPFTRLYVVMGFRAFKILDVACMGRASCFERGVQVVIWAMRDLGYETFDGLFILFWLDVTSPECQIKVARNLAGVYAPF